MHTPGHAVLNLVLLAQVADLGIGFGGGGGGSGGGGESNAGLFVLAGAVVPDLPIIALYAIERARGRPEEDIWRSVYPTRPWIDIIHGAHSIPIALAGLAAAAALGTPAGLAFFASLLLHSLLDLPLHAEDAHRHFLPFSSWRLVSPISYWDVRYHGRTVSLLEATAVALAAIWLWPGAALIGRLALLAVAGFYAHGCWQLCQTARRALS